MCMDIARHVISSDVEILVLYVFCVCRYKVCCILCGCVGGALVGLQRLFEATSIVVVTGGA